MSRDLERSAVGLTWHEFVHGRRFRTMARTITESDVVGFVTSMGLFEPLFLDARDETLGGGRRVAPGALTFAIAEGLVVQTQIIQGTGMALLGAELKMCKPVFVGDTIDVDIEVVESRASSTPGRGVVTTRNLVYNQDDVVVLEYMPVRLVSETHH